MRSKLNNMEEIQKIRELERRIIADAKNTNSLLIIKKQLQNESSPKEERMAALHSLRRIFVHFLENGRLETLSAASDKSGKIQEYKKWLTQQFHSLQDTLTLLIGSNDPSFQAPAIRTMMEVYMHAYQSYVLRRSLLSLTIYCTCLKSAHATYYYVGIQTESFFSLFLSMLLIYSSSLS